MKSQFVQMTKSKLIPVCLYQAENLIREVNQQKRRRPIFWNLNSNSKYDRWRSPRAVKRMAAKYLENAFSQFVDLSLPLPVTSPLPFPSYFPGSPALSVLNGRAQCSAKEIPSFPSWLTRKLFRSQLFPGGGLTAYRERGRLSQELSPRAGQLADVGPTTRPQAASAV